MKAKQKKVAAAVAAAVAPIDAKAIVAAMPAAEVRKRLATPIGYEGEDPAPLGKAARETWFYAKGMRLGANHAQGIITWNRYIGMLKTEGERNALRKGYIDAVAPIMLDEWNAENPDASADDVAAAEKRSESSAARTFSNRCKQVEAALNIVLPNRKAASNVGKQEAAPADAADADDADDSGIDAHAEKLEKTYSEKEMARAIAGALAFCVEWQGSTKSQSVLDRIAQLAALLAPSKRGRKSK